MALTQDELGNWYDDGSTDNYDFGYGDNSGYSDSYDFWADIGIDPNTTGEGGSPTPDSSWDGSSNVVGTLKQIAATAGKMGFNKLKQAFTKKDKDGKDVVDWAAVATAGMGLYNLNNKPEGGYNKPVPKMDMVREQVQYNDPNRRPGESGRQYFTDPRFVAQGDAGAMDAARAASAAQASGLQAAARVAPEPTPNPYTGKMNLSFAQQRQVPTSDEGLPQIPTKLNDQGGIKMAAGGLADAGRYLQGKTDGMADEIETSIDGEQPALLSHGEFVIPADVVSHLGNGNSEAGAEKLYAMMDKIREARTGTKEQGKEINADKFLAAASGGLMAAYAGGGAVQKFNVGGPATPNPTPVTAGQGVPLDTSRTSTLSPWVGDYVTNALGQGAALASAPYQAYQGPLTAGASDLQNQAFAGASEMAQTGYTPGQFTGSFTPQMAAQYMNPYLQASLDPQLKELNRQSEIARIQDAGRLTKAGAFGGSRQAIMESEGRRNLLDKQAGVLGTGYKTAFDLAQQQYAKDRGEEEASRQFGANYGLKTIDQLSGLGATQRGITSEGIAADKAQFEEQRDFAYKMPQYQLNLLQGLPIGANTTSANQAGIEKLQSDIAGLVGAYKTIKGSLDALGQTPSATPAVPKP